MKRCYTIFIAAIALLLLSLSVSADSNPFCPSGSQSDVIPSAPPAAKSDGRATYTGTLRTYILEPVSRWRDHVGANYGHAFLDWGPGGTLNIADGTRWEGSATWNSATAGIGAITSTNIEAASAIFNSNGVLTDAYPPNGAYFIAYYCDAAALATPGVPGHNETATGFTHSVFLEEGTAEWCQYCPATHNAVEHIFDSHDYPFLYAAMVTDHSGKALDRMTTDLNIPGYPTCYFDGGYRTFVGGSTVENDYRTRIVVAGARRGSAA